MRMGKDTSVYSDVERKMFYVPEPSLEYSVPDVTTGKNRELRKRVPNEVLEVSTEKRELHRNSLLATKTHAFTRRRRLPPLPNARERLSDTNATNVTRERPLNEQTQRKAFTVHGARFFVVMCRAVGERCDYDEGLSVTKTVLTIISSDHVRVRRTRASYQRVSVAAARRWTVVH